MRYIKVYQSAWHPATAFDILRPGSLFMETVPASGMNDKSGQLFSMLAERFKFEEGFVIAWMEKQEATQDRMLACSAPGCGAQAIKASSLAPGMSWMFAPGLPLRQIVRVEVMPSKKARPGIAEITYSEPDHSFHFRAYLSPDDYVVAQAAKAAKGEA